MIKYSLFSFLILFPCALVADEAKPLIIEKKSDAKVLKMSKNSLKEHLGESTRDAFHATTELSRRMGELQIELVQGDVQPAAQSAEQKKEVVTSSPILQVSGQTFKQIGHFHIELAAVQKRFSGIIEQLLENRAPFKKAGTSALRGAYTLMMDVEKELKKQVDVCSKFTAQLSKSDASKKQSAVKKAELNVQKHVDALKKIQQDMSSHECLKIV